MLWAAILMIHRYPHDRQTPFHIIKALQAMNDGEYLRLENEIVPNNFPTSRKFKKHGKYVRLDVPSTQKEAHAQRKDTHILRKEA